MKDTDLQTGLRSLQDSLRRMKGLLAWGQLKQHEARPGEPPSFRMYDPTETDLRNEYSRFLSTSTEMHAVLHAHSASIPALRETLQRKLAELEQEAHQLNVNRRSPEY